MNGLYWVVGFEVGNEGKCTSLIWEECAWERFVVKSGFVCERI